MGMVGIKDEDWEALCGTEMFPDLGLNFWSEIPDDTLARRSRQIAREKKQGRRRINFNDGSVKAEGFTWAEENLAPMPLLREDTIGRVHRYEYDPVKKRYVRKKVIAEKVSLEYIYTLRMEIMEQFDAETKGEKDGI